MKTIITSYLALVAILFGAIVMVHFIPKQWINTNVQSSVEIFRKEGLYPNILNFKLFQLDNYSDAMMMNMAISADSSHPVRSAMLNNWHTSGRYFDMAEDADKVAKNHLESLKAQPYGRYWNGYQIFLRPLLCLFNYREIRLLNYLLLSSLLITISWLMITKVGKSATMLFLASLACINFPIVPLSIHFSAVFYITFISIAFILLERGFILKHQLFNGLFFIIGGLTSSLDLLTAPLITLGIPLLVYIIYLNPIHKIRTVILGSGVWFLGYTSIWVTKWGLGTLLTGVNLMQDASDAAAVRLSKRIFTGMEVTIPNMLEFAYTYLQQRHLFWPLIILLLIVLASLVGAVKNWQKVKENSYLLLISLMVPVWYLVVRNHSVQHGWFTWRATVVSVFAGLLFMSRAMSFERYHSLFKRVIPSVNK
jgi:hypothetical protein